MRLDPILPRRSANSSRSDLFMHYQELEAGVPMLRPATCDLGANQAMLCIIVDEARSANPHWAQASDVSGTAG